MQTILRTLQSLTDDSIIIQAFLLSMHAKTIEASGAWEQFEKVVKQ